MLRYSALARAAWRGASKHDAHVTKSLYQFPILPQSSSIVSNGSSVLCIRGLATKVAKKPARKTAVVKKTTTTKRTTTKKKAVPKKKVAAKKKPTPRRKVVKKKVAKKKVAPKKKVLTERQKLLAAKKKAREELAALKATALEEPKRTAETAWIVFVAEKLKGHTGPAAAVMKESAPAFKALTASELEVRRVDIWITTRL